MHAAGPRVSSKLLKVQLSGIKHCSFSNARLEYLSPRSVEGMTDGDRVVLDAPLIFEIYAENDHSRQWTWNRLTAGRAGRVVALGTIAEHGLLRLFAHVGCLIRHTASGRECRLRPHPAGGWLRGYADATLGRWLE